MPDLKPRTSVEDEDSSDDQDSDSKDKDWNSDNEDQILEFQTVKLEQELWIKQQITKEGCKTLEDFHGLFPLRKKYAN